MKDHMKIQTHPLACEENIIKGEHYRITVLTKSLVRLEYSPTGHFTDAATQVVLNRDFAPVEFLCTETKDGLMIRTEYFQLNYNRQEFSGAGLSCACMGMEMEGMPGGNRMVWHYGDAPRTLKGTARTLDQVNGACELEEGLMSFWSGCAPLDDSHTLLIGEDGWVVPREQGGQDLYLFAYGHRYLEALKDFYRLCGRTPMLPRFALGNWWSRYYRYTEESYMELMRRFDEEDLPFSVAVIDMDWHLTKIDPKYGTGWTGYTWDPECFPDPERFLAGLHARGMKTTLNVHPADGIRAFEDCYKEVAKAMGVDIQKEEPVNFDIADPHFMEVYFEKVHHPLEEQGVDFWWIDWQQGTHTKVAGLDPLWMLNHYHFLDSARDGKRPMTFSRYAGPGSHRYPVGFSGDTVITWESLDFQPYFTNTASNIGYGWWSHDIGGHMMGGKDDELETRWYQYGVFSPVNRLHSTSSEFNGKEPWRFKKEAHDAMNRFLRLRHQMLPYLYTMNYRAWADGEPVCQPVYYRYPAKWESYKYKNQYFFGSELMVAPITAPRAKGVNVAEVTAWLPQGLWFDFFTGTVYHGGRSLILCRGIDTIPVLAKAGAILPMTEQYQADQAEKNPDELTIRIYPGADNSFTLYEDDNVSAAYEDGVCAKTVIALDWEKKRVSIAPVLGDASLVPAERTIKLELCNITAEHAEVSVNGAKQSGCCEKHGTGLLVTLTGITPADAVEVVLPKDTAVAKNPMKEMLYDFLNQAEIGFMQKQTIFGAYQRLADDVPAFLSELQAMGASEQLQHALAEITGAYRG